MTENAPAELEQRSMAIVDDWLPAIVAALAQLYFFAIGATALSVYKFDMGGLPSRVPRFLGVQRFVGGTTSLATGLFWSSVALLLGFGLIASGLVVGSPQQVSAGAGSLLLDLVWLMLLRRWTH